MSGLFDFLQNPFIIPIIIIGFLAILGLLHKSGKMRRIAKIAAWILFFWLWIVLVENVIMPSSGIPMTSMDYTYVNLFLTSIPFLIFIVKA